MLEERNNSAFFESLTEKEKIEIIEKNPTFIVKLDEETILRFISKGNNTRFIKLLPYDFQMKLLKQELTFKTKNGFQMIINLTPEYFIPHLRNFSSKVILDITKYYIENSPKSKDFLNKMKIGLFDIDLQVELLSLNNMFINNMSRSEVKRLIRFASKDPKNKNKLPFLDYDLNDPEIDIENIKKQITKDNNRNLPLFSNFYYNVKDNNSLIELARFEPSVLATWGCSYCDIYDKIISVIDLYKSQFKNEEVLYALDSLKEKLLSIENHGLETNLLTENLPKVLLNKQVLEKVNPNLIAEFIKYPDNREILQNIIKLIYGEKSIELLQERPDITLSQIPNLEIFDPIVIEKFGKGTVHNMLSYSTNSADVLCHLVRNPEKMQRFEVFEKLFDFGKNDVLEFNDKLLLYNKLENLLDKIDIDELTDKQKENLVLLCNDKFMSVKEDERTAIKVESLEDLDSYISKRNATYDNIAKKAVSPIELKIAISKRFFGMDYTQGKQNTIVKQTHLPLDKMLQIYNVEKFITDERTLDSNMFTDDELDMLEIASIICKIDDIEVLREIYKTLSEREDILKPADFIKLKTKIPMQYSKELVNSLLTVDSVKERVKNGEKGIEYQETEDGLEIITLSGADFRIMLHTAGINASNHKLPYDYDISELWKYYEKGCSTISCSVIEEDMLMSCALYGKPINFGFSSVPPKQVIGMSYTDAQIAHDSRLIDPYFSYSKLYFDYPDELVRLTADHIENKNDGHDYNEVAMFRRYVEKEYPNYGEKIMPDYIVVYGKATNEHKELAKKFIKNGKPLPIVEINVKSYEEIEKQAFLRGKETRKENHTKKRENGHILKEIKKIIPRQALQNALLDTTSSEAYNARVVENDAQLKSSLDSSKEDI